MEGTHLRTLIPRTGRTIDLVEEFRRSAARHPECFIRTYCIVGGLAFSMTFGGKRADGGNALEVDLGAIFIVSAADGEQIKIDADTPRVMIPRYITPATRLFRGGSTVQRITFTHTVDYWGGMSTGNRCSLR